PLALRQRVRPGQDDDELFPSQSDQRAFPLGRARSDCNVTDTRSHRVVECLTVCELAQGNPGRRMVCMPQLKSWWCESEGSRRHGSYFEFSTFESEHAARIALCAIGMFDGSARLGQELFAGRGKANALGYALQ